MEVALRGMSGLGATSVSGVIYNDTGAGIAPETFQASCCLGLAGSYGSSVGSQLWDSIIGAPSAGPDCDAFVAANPSLFGSNSPCSPTALQNLTTPAPVLSVATVQPPASSGSTVYVPVVACPSSVSPCPCNGQPVVTSADQANLLTCQSLQQASTQNTAVTTQLTANQAAQCTNQKVVCAQNYFETAVSSDCSTCILDFTSGYTWAAIAAGLFILGTLFLAKR